MTILGWIAVGLGFILVVMLGWLAWEAKHAPLMDENGHYLDENGRVISKAESLKTRGLLPDRRPISTDKRLGVK